MEPKAESGGSNYLPYGKSTSNYQIFIYQKVGNKAIDQRYLCTLVLPMHSHDLFDVLSAIHPLSEEFERSLEVELVPASFERNHILLDVPRIADFVYFIQRGMAMSYSVEKKKKVVDCFWQGGQIMTSVSSFCGDMPTTITIQLMSDADLLCLSKEALNRLLDKHQDAHLLYHKIVARYHKKCQKRIQDIQRKSAAARFESLIKAYPELEQFVPQENIASYLGITPQSLSRIKRLKTNGEDEVSEV